MPDTSTLRKWLTIPVLIIGALTTMATSPVEPIRLTSDLELILEPREAVYLEVVLNEVAMDHVRRYEGTGSIYSLAVEVSGEDVLIVPDDEVFPPQEDSARFALGLSACPESGRCILGYTIESTGEIESAVNVMAMALVDADSSFLFPENRDFPAEAEIRIVVDGE